MQVGAVVWRWVAGSGITPLAASPEAHLGIISVSVETVYQPLFTLFQSGETDQSKQETYQPHNKIDNSAHGLPPFPFLFISLFSLFTYGDQKSCT
jgi:hypothetical protein